MLYCCSIVIIYVTQEKQVRRRTAPHHRRLEDDFNVRLVLRIKPFARTGIASKSNILTVLESEAISIEK